MRLVSSLQRAAELLLIVAAIIAPFVVSGFTLFQLSQAVCYGIGVLGLKLLIGYNGQFSLGHGIFFAAGAYTTTVLTANGAGFYSGVLAGTLAAFLFGFAIGWPALRIRGHQLAIVTLVFALAVPQIVRSSALTDITGGPGGIGFDTLPVPIGGWTGDEWWYAIAVATALALSLLAAFVVRTKAGRSMQACRDNLIAARASGINPTWINTLTFGFSAASAGLAGGLMMGPLAYVGPDSFPVLLGISLFVAVLVTGPKWIGGSFVGGLLIVFLPNWAEGISVALGKSQALTFAVYGVLLLAILYVQLIDWRRAKNWLKPSYRKTSARRSGDA